MVVYIIIDIMRNKLHTFQPKLVVRMAGLGERLRLARLRRNFSASTVATRADVSRMTLHKIESGDPTVAFGYYAKVLSILHIDADLDHLAKDDALGRRLQDLRIPARRRAPKRPKAGQGGPGDP